MSQSYQRRGVVIDDCCRNLTHIEAREKKGRRPHVLVSSRCKGWALGMN